MTLNRNILRLPGALLLAVVAIGALPGSSSAQQKIGYIDSEYVLGKTPEYVTVQQQIDRLAQDWQNELDQRKKEVDDLFQEYQARELLYTAEENQRRREEIMQAEGDTERLRIQYFGPEGDLFQQQDKLMRPIQERILSAIEQVAQEGGYDYVFDKSGDFLFVYTREANNLSNRILEELGIDVESTQGVPN